MAQTKMGWRFAMKKEGGLDFLSFSRTCLSSYLGISTWKNKRTGKLSRWIPTIGSRVCSYLLTTFVLRGDVHCGSVDERF